MAEVTTAQCADDKCGIGARGLKAIRKIFGFRNDHGTVRPQSRCRVCRTRHQRERKAMMTELRLLYHTKFPKDATWESSSESFLREKLGL